MDPSTAEIAQEIEKVMQWLFTLIAGVLFGYNLRDIGDAARAVLRLLAAAIVSPRVDDDAAKAGTASPYGVDDAADGAPRHPADCDGSQR